jgi:hypothetical protein
MSGHDAVSRLNNKGFPRTSFSVGDRDLPLLFLRVERGDPTVLSGGARVDTRTQGGPIPMAWLFPLSFLKTYGGERPDCLSALGSCASAGVEPQRPAFSQVVELLFPFPLEMTGQTIYLSVLETAVLPSLLSCNGPRSG